MEPQVEGCSRGHLNSTVGRSRAKRDKVAEPAWLEGRKVGQEKLLEVEKYVLPHMRRSITTGVELLQSMRSELEHVEGSGPGRNGRDGNRYVALGHRRNHNHPSRDGARRTCFDEERRD